MSDTVGNSLAQRLITFSADLAAFAASWERSTTPDHPETIHSSDYGRKFTEKFESHLERLSIEVANEGLSVDDLAVDPAPSAAQLRVIADKLTLIASALLARS